MKKMLRDLDRELAGRQELRESAIREGQEFGVRWSEFDRNDKIVKKQKMFSTQDQLNAFVKKLIDQDNFNRIESWTGGPVEEANATGNMDGGAGPIKTPKAFSRTGEEDENDNAEVFDYKKAKETHVNFKPRQDKAFQTKPMARESAFRRLAMDINEISYREYKADEEATPHQKISQAIKEINGKLFELERVVNRNVKLKTEMGVSADAYWEKSRAKMGKIAERMLSIAKKMRDLNA
jgi:hypothetical protein